MVYDTKWKHENGHVHSDEFFLRADILLNSSCHACVRTMFVCQACVRIFTSLLYQSFIAQPSLVFSCLQNTHCESRHMTLQCVMDYELILEKSPLIQQISILGIVPCVCMLNLYWFISFSTKACSKREDTKKEK